MAEGVGLEDEAKSAVDRLSKGVEGREGSLLDTTHG